MPAFFTFPAVLFSTLSLLLPADPPSAYPNSALACATPAPRGPIANVDAFGDELPPLDFIIQPNGALAWLINGQSNPTLTLNVGQT